MKLSILKLTAASALSILALAACESRDNRQSATDERAPSTQEEQRATENRPSDRDDEVVQRESTTTDQGALGGTAVEEGKAKIEGQETVVKRERSKTERDIPTVITGSKKADINEMDAEDFVALGLKKDIAEKVISYRDQHGGKFQSVDQLSQVPGMDSQWYKQKKNLLGVKPSQVGGEEK